MSTIPGTTIEIPTTHPINLEGEADAYAGESFDNAYARLRHAGDACGFMVCREVSVHGASVIVYQSRRQYRVRFDPVSLVFVGVQYRGARAESLDPWTDLYTTAAGNKLEAQDIMREVARLRKLAADMVGTGNAAEVNRLVAQIGKLEQQAAWKAGTRNVTWNPFDSVD